MGEILQAKRSLINIVPGRLKVVEMGLCSVNNFGWK